MGKNHKRNQKKKKEYITILRKFIRKTGSFVSQNQNRVMLGFMCLVMICMVCVVEYGFQKKESRETMVQKPVKTEKPLEKETTSPTPSPAKTPNPEEKIYSYLQGPKSWGQRLTWSGKWGETFMDGGSFGGFGCGLCCVANVYSSLTKYQCSPVDAYQFAKRKTGYGGGGAIEWGYMRRSLTAMGMNCKVKKKTKTYKAFQKDMASGQCAIVLVSSMNSTCYWKDTPGHYVTLFLYEPKSDKVFLADSGDPHHNRKRVSLKKIYRSLKTSSTWQYLKVKKYNPKKDTWKHKSANGNWVRPQK